jgi:hypothetical protein
MTGIRIVLQANPQWIVIEKPVFSQEKHDAYHEIINLNTYFYPKFKKPFYANFCTGNLCILYL